MSNQIKHRKLGHEPLVGLYYVAECIKCGWIGSSGELTEDDAQCLQPVGDDHCWGDTDEIGADRLLELMQSGAFDKPATLLKSEPVAVLYADGAVLTKAECGNCFEICCKVETPLYAEQPALVSPDLVRDRSYRDGLKRGFGLGENGRVEQYHKEFAAYQLGIVGTRKEQPAPIAVMPEGYCLMPISLTAENGAKALLLGEFTLKVTMDCSECCELEEPSEGCEICDGEGEYGQKQTIPWDQIKFIYSKAVEGLAK